MRDTGLANRIRSKAVEVVEVAGWIDRGSDLSNDFYGAGLHHTAGSPNGEAPSYNTCLNGRPEDGIPGPLCNVLQGRHASNPLGDRAFVMSAGKANHGGNGAWHGVSGNSKFHGLEVEHPGTGPVPSGRLEVAARIIAAMCEAPGARRDAYWVWNHFEYALPPGRKIDFFDLTPYTPNGFRDRVQWWIGRTGTEAADQLYQEDQMFTFAGPSKPTMFVEGGQAAGLNESSDLVMIQQECARVKVPLPHFSFDAETYSEFVTRFRDHG